MPANVRRLFLRDRLTPGLLTSGQAAVIAGQPARAAIPAWLPLGLLVGLAGVQAFDYNAFGILAPNIASTFHLSVPAIDSIATLTSAVPVVFSVHLGFYGDRHSRIRISVLAGLVWGVTAMVTGLAPVVAVLIGARIAGGIGQLATETIYPSLLADYYSSSDIGKIFSRYRWISQGVGLIGGPLAGLLAAVAGWRTAFVVLAIPTFVLVACLRLMHEPTRGASMGFSLGDAGVLSIRQGFRRVAQIRTLRRVWVAAFLFGAGTIPFQTVLNNFFADVYHLGDTSRGYISLIYGIGGVAGIMFGGRMATSQLNAGRTKMLSVVSGLLVLVCGVGTLAVGAAPALWLSILAASVATIGSLGFLPAYTTLVAFVASPRLRAQAYGWSLLFYALGAIVIQAAVVGPVITAAGQRAALVVLGVLVGAGGVIAISTQRFVDADMSRAFSGEEATA